MFLADSKAQVLMNDIPDELVINWDQTALPLVPTGEWTMHHAGEKMIPIAKSDDERQITAVFAASMTGEYLAPQLIFKGRQNVAIHKCVVNTNMNDGTDKNLIHES